MTSEAPVNVIASANILGPLNAEYGHGTAEAANIFASAPDIDFIGVKMGNNPTLAFKTASDLYPHVMTNSWGYDLCGQLQLPNFLKPLEMAVLEAVYERG